MALKKTVKQNKSQSTYPKHVKSSKILHYSLLLSSTKATFLEATVRATCPTCWQL